jgi:hypothetical protein
VVKICSESAIIRAIRGKNFTSAIFLSAEALSRFDRLKAQSKSRGLSNGAKADATLV